jgi:glycopeptide antibiotics resistance protein
MFKLPFYSPTADERAINLIPLMGSFDEQGVLVLREIVYNILLFIPLGLYVSMLKSDWPTKRKVALIISITLLLEVLQYAFALGRSDITDVIGNTIGGLTGICGYALLSRLLKDQTAKIIIPTAAVVTIFVTARFAHLFYLSHFVMTRPEGL